MSVSVTIRVKKELVELANEMVKLGLARSRSHAFNKMIVNGLKKTKEEVEHWKKVMKTAEELKRKGYKIEHGGLSSLLEEERSHR